MCKNPQKDFFVLSHFHSGVFVLNILREKMNLQNAFFQRKQRELAPPKLLLLPWRCCHITESCRRLWVAEIWLVFNPEHNENTSQEMTCRRVPPTAMTCLLMIWVVQIIWYEFLKGHLSLVALLLQLNSLSDRHFYKLSLSKLHNMEPRWTHCHQLHCHHSVISLSFCLILPKKALPFILKFFCLFCQAK